MLNGQARQFFQEWYQTSLGERLLSEEHEAIEQALDHVIGYYLLIQSPLKQLQLHNHRMRETLNIAPVLELGAPANTVVAAMDELPFDGDGLDAIVLHHTLDLSENPHRDLHEVARTLLPSGKLIIVGFNPWSTWGLRRPFVKRNRAPWAARFISPARIEDWLKVAGLTLDKREFVGFDVPLQSDRWRSRCGGLGRGMQSINLPFGCVYVLTATKQTRRYIPIKPRWSAAKVRVPPLTKPTIKEVGFTSNHEKISE
jgi:SAM-dependent methyltransferase